MGLLKAGGAQNGHCLFCEGEHEEDNNLIVDQNLNLFLWVACSHLYLTPKKK